MLCARRPAVQATNRSIPSPAPPAARCDQRGQGAGDRGPARGQSGPGGDDLGPDRRPRRDQSGHEPPMIAIPAAGDCGSLQLPAERRPDPAAPLPQAQADRARRAGRPDRRPGGEAGGAPGGPRRSPRARSGHRRAIRFSTEPAFRRPGPVPGARLPLGDRGQARHCRPAGGCRSGNSRPRSAPRSTPSWARPSSAASRRRASGPASPPRVRETAGLVLSEVMEHYGLAWPLDEAGFFETEHQREGHQAGEGGGPGRAPGGAERAGPRRQDRAGAAAPGRARPRGQGAGRQVALGRQGAGHAPDPDDRAVLRPLARGGALDPEPGRAARARAAQPDPQGQEAGGPVRRRGALPPPRRRCAG